MAKHVRLPLQTGDKPLSHHAEQGSALPSVYHKRKMKVSEEIFTKGKRLTMEQARIIWGRGPLPGGKEETPP
jgi:hypothetical protein